MSVFVKTIAALGVAASMLATTAPSYAAEAYNFARVGNWKIVFARNNARSLCYANVQYRDGSDLYVKRTNEERRVFLHIYNASWRKLPTGQQFSVRVSFVGRGKSFNGTATAISYNGVGGIQLTLGSYPYRLMSSATSIRIETRSGALIGNYNLADSGSALSAFGRCVARYVQ